MLPDSPLALLCPETSLDRCGRSIGLELGPASMPHSGRGVVGRESCRSGVPYLERSNHPIRPSKDGESVIGGISRASALSISSTRIL